MTNVLLEVTNLRVAYGGIQAVKGVNFKVAEGELVSLIGANGAGKTTTLKAVTGIQPIAAGDIKFLGKSIVGQGAWNLVKQGLVMVPEGRGTFTRMTITENLLMGAHVRKDNEIQANIDKVFTTFPRLKERATQLAGTMSGGEQQMLAMGRALMARPKVLLLDEPSMGLSPIMVDKIFGIFPRLKERRNQLAGTMSGGEQQMLAMGRALMARPKVLLLDEPSMGLSPIMVDKIFEVIEAIHTQGTTILLVEQNASRALGLADRGYVMESGEVTMSGEAKALLADPKVRAAYLGE